MAWFWRLWPLWAFYPFRLAAARLRRRSLIRGFSILLLRQVRRAWHRRLAGVVGAVVPLDRSDLSFESVDSMVMDAVFWFGVRGYEGLVAQVWADTCRDARSVLEVGGNVGLFSVIGAKAGAGAYTVVEPVPAIAEILRCNLARNRLPDARVIVAAAIPGNEAATVRLSIPDNSRGAPVDGSLVGMTEGAVHADAIILDVAGIPFREMARGHDVIKIDAEGVEAALLASVEDLLLRERPTLLIEVLPESVRLGRFLSDLAVAAGYEIVVIPEWGADAVVTVDAASFSADVPGRYHSKDVLLRVSGPSRQ